MTRTIKFTLNGEPVAAEIEPHHNLVELLQREFAFLGARKLRPGPVRLLHRAGERHRGVRLPLPRGVRRRRRGDHGRSLANGDTLSPVQEAFIEAGAFQCGYCTPGFVLMTTQLLDAHPDPDDDQIRHYLSGNLCRCAAYPEIINAAKLAARKRRAAAPG